MGPSSCHEYRVAALERAELPVHECATCAAWMRRLAAREGLVSSLPRLVAPPELAARSVAAAHAGERQERAIRALQSLGRVHPDGELDRAVEQAAQDAAGEPLAALSGRQRAPAVLDRLVAEELADPAKARVARQLGSLARLSAPDELSEAVTARLEHGSEPAVGQRTIVAWLTAAAALLFVALAPVAWRRGGSGPKERPFRVEVVESLDQLSPLARDWIDKASSGMFPQRQG